MSADIDQLTQEITLKVLDAAAHRLETQRQEQRKRLKYGAFIAIAGGFYSLSLILFGFFLSGSIAKGEIPGEAGAALISLLVLVVMTVIVVREK